MPNYQPMLRPAEYGTMPNVPWEYVEVPRNLTHLRSDLPVSRHLHGVVKTARELTDDEKSRYDLRPC